jgi:hypothetical protein
MHNLLLGSDKFSMPYFVHKSNGRGFEGVLLWQVNFHLPNTPFIRGAFGPEEFNDKLVQATENGDFVFTLN